MRKAVIPSVLLLAAALLASCDGDDKASDRPAARVAEAMASSEFAEACEATTGCAEAIESGPSETIWRVAVTRSAAGEATLGAIEAVEVPEGDGVPVGPLSGDLLLVGLDESGEAIDGQLIRFPRTLRVEYAEGGSPRLLDLAGRETSSIGYLKALPGIVNLALQDSEGTVLASRDVPSKLAGLSRQPQARGGLGLASPAWAQSRRPWQGLPGHCSHIIVLLGERDRQYAAGVSYEDKVTLVYPGPWALAATRAALERMTPLLCQSIGRLAFGRVFEAPSAKGVVNSFGAGDMILINLNFVRFREADLEDKRSSRLMLQQTLIHEAAHAAETLLATESADGGPTQGIQQGFKRYGGNWNYPARTLARSTIENVRLEKGLPREWQRLHQSFVTQGWAAPYASLSAMEQLEGQVANTMEQLDMIPPQAPQPPESASWSSEQVAKAGLMDARGHQNWAEDIGYFVGNTYLGADMAAGIAEAGVSQTLRTDQACVEMQAHGEKNIPSRLAAVYTKLMFLQDLGMVRKEDVETCVGDNLGLEGLDSKGFHFYQGSIRLRKFGNNVEAGIGRHGMNNVFELRAEGKASFDDKEYPASLKLRLDLGGPLDTVAEQMTVDQVSWPRGIYKLGLFGDNTLLLRLDGAPAGDFNAKEGFVMVSEASNKRITGSIFLTQAFRVSAPLPVPQVFDPPLNIRFLIEK